MDPSINTYLLEPLTRVVITLRCRFELSYSANTVRVGCIFSSRVVEICVYQSLLA